MKAIFPCSYFLPETAASLYLTDNIVNACAENDVEVDLYTPTPTRNVPLGAKWNREDQSVNGKLRVHRFHLYGEGKNPILRAFRYLLGEFILLHFCLWKEYDVAFIDSTPPIQGLKMPLIKWLKRKPTVYNAQDLFPDSLVGTGLTNEGGLIWKIGRVIEKITYKYSDKIIVISQDFRKNLLAKGVPDEKIVVIYNWVDQNAVINIPRSENKLFDKYQLDRSKFYITYSGNIGLTQNMDMLLSVAEEFQCAKGSEFQVSGFQGSKIQEVSGGSKFQEVEGKTVDYSDIIFVLIGEGAYKEQVEKIVKEKKLTNVVMIPFQPYEDISQVFSLGDAGLVISKPGVGANSVPSKTWSIMSVSRPVLANFDENELKSILIDNECGIFTKAGDKEAFKQSIITLYKNRDLCKKYGDNGRKFVMANLTKEVGTAKYVQIIKEVVEASKRKNDI